MRRPGVVLMTEQSRSIRFIDKDNRRIELTSGSIIISYPLNAIPDPIFLAMAEGPRGQGTPEEQLELLYSQTVMKPTLSTLGPSMPFGMNAVKKLARLTWKDEVIEERIEELEGDVLALQGRPFSDTIEERFDIYKKIYLDDNDIDRLRFGAIEIFGGITYNNLRLDPRAALNFYWRDEQRPHDRSYQVNCIAEIVGQDDPFFRFMRVIRGLFSYIFLDLNKPDYIAAYKLWVSEAVDKTLTERLGFTP